MKLQKRMSNTILSEDNIDKHIEEIVKIHKNAYHHDHFTSKFPMAKLREYYKHLISKSDVSIINIDSDTGKCVGFIIAGRTVSQGVQDFILKNKTFLILTMIKNPIFLYEKLYSILYQRLIKTKSVKAEFRLLSISVDKAYQSMGIGKSMITFFERQLVKFGEKTYGLSVRKNNKRAVCFYKKNGFKVDKEYMNSIYFYKNCS